jgi:hypothetical protein
MQPIRTFSITAPGFAGLNTQDAPVDMDSKFALEANNCIIDKFGRVGSRKGWETVSDTSVALGSADIECIGELIETTGTSTIVAAGNGKLFKLVGSTLTELTYGGGGAAPTIVLNNWQTCDLNGAIIFFQEGYDALTYDPSLSTTTYRRLSEHPSATGTVPKANCAISAYGRIWAARTDTDHMTVYWTDTLTHQKWSGGTSGSLNLYGVFPQGGDEIVGLAAHNNQLIIFGAKQILIYTGAKDPSTMTLYDAIGNCGCMGRDTIENLPDDIVFLSGGGLRTLGRTIQEKSAPITTISRTVNDDLLSYLINENSATTIRSIYSPVDAFYLLTFKNSLVTFCFDMRTPMQDGSYRVTTWSSIHPRCYHYSSDRVLYMGQPGYIAQYAGYSDNGAEYRMSYYTNWIDFGDPIRTSVFKKAVLSLFGTLNQQVVLKWGFDYTSATKSATTTITDTSTVAEYNIAEYGIGEYTRNLVIKSLGLQGSGTGKVFQVGIECQIVGYPISIQRIDIYTKDGAYK